MSLLTPRQRSDVFSMFPSFAADPENGYGPRARPYLTRREAMKLSRTTEWEDLGNDMFAGLGQRLLTTDQSDVSLMDTRNFQFAPVSVATEGEVGVDG